MWENINKLVREICRNLGVRSQYYDDLVEEVLVILLNMDSDKIEEMYSNNQLRFFVTRIVKNQYHSNTSPFYKLYRKQYEFYDGNISDVIKQDDDDGDTEDE